MQRRQFNACLAASFGGAWQSASAQSDRPISLIVGYAAGGSADLTARIVGNEMARRLARPVIVENVSGASGMLAVTKVLNGPVDGTYIYMGGTDTVVVPMVNNRVRHDWAKDFMPIGRMTTVPMVFAVPAASPYQSLPDLLAALRKSGKDQFSYGTPGIGTMQHFYAELICKQGKVAMTHVPYRGGTHIANDLVGQQIDSAVLVLSTALPFLRDGKIRALSMSDTARSPQLPNVRSIGEEEGFKGVSLPLWQGLFVKTGVPAAVVKNYETALLESLAQPDVQSKLKDGGITVSPLSGSQLRQFVVQQAVTYRDIATTARITVE